MEVRQDDNGHKGEFFIELDGQRVGRMSYVWSGPDKIIIDHTEVGDQLKGQGAGKVLLEKAVEFARQKNIKIMPLCPFAKSVFDKTPQYADVLF